MLELPSHIEQKSEKWYFNTKSGKFIHSDFIEAWLERYWRNRKGTVKPKTLYNKTVKSAKRRWENEP